MDVNKIHFVLASVKNKKNLVNEVFNLLNQFRGKYNLESNNFYYEKLAKAGRYDTKEVIFLKRILQVELEEELRLILTDLLFKKFVDIPEEIFSKDLYMNINEIKIMKKNGMHIGSHGFDHYWLNSLTKNVQEDEIKKSLIFLKLIGCDLENWTMCYPYGAYNQDTLDLLEMYNCKLALTTKIKVQQIDNKQRYEFGRLDTNDLPKDINSKTKKWYNQA